MPEVGYFITVLLVLCLAFLSLSMNQSLQFLQLCATGDISLFKNTKLSDQVADVFCGRFSDGLSLSSTNLR